MPTETSSFWIQKSQTKARCIYLVATQIRLPVHDLPHILARQNHLRFLCDVVPIQNCSNPMKRFFDFLHVVQVFENILMRFSYTGNTIAIPPRMRPIYW